MKKLCSLLLCLCLFISLAVGAWANPVGSAAVNPMAVMAVLDEGDAAPEEAPTEETQPVAVEKEELLLPEETAEEPLLDGAAADTDWYGDGSADSFTITTAAQLRGLAELVNGGSSFHKKTITLGASIDLAGEAWTPIGTTANRFLGSFDGGGNKISNLNAALTDSDCVGLFGAAGMGDYPAVIRDLTVENVTVSGRQSVGAIVGNGVGTIENCQVTGAVSVTGSDRYVGGVAGYYYGKILNCSVSATPAGTVTARFMVGGIVGFMGEGNAVNSMVLDGNVLENVTVTATSGGWVGGIAGSILEGTTVSDNTVKGSKIDAGNDGYGGGGGLSGLIVGQTGGGNVPIYVINNAADANTSGTVNGNAMENIAGPLGADNAAIGSDVTLDENGQILSGNFVVLEDSLLSDKAELSTNPDGSYTVRHYVASVTDGEGNVTKYETLAAALAAGEGKTVSLLENVTEDVTATADTSLDLGAFSLSGKLTVAAGKTLTISGSGDGADTTLDLEDDTAGLRRATGSFASVELAENCVWLSDDSGDTLIKRVAQRFASDFTAAMKAEPGQQGLGRTAVLEKGDGAITYISSDPAVAEVDANGELTVKGLGTATITATAAETERYFETSASYTLTVAEKTPEPPQEEKPGGDPEIPSTGDGAMPVLWLSLALGAAALLLSLRRRERA